jgi:multimeric flavodoxin WrbA
MAKNIMVVVGSPRKKGNSATLAAEVVQGAREEGAKVESVFLHRLDIRPCTACDSCRRKLSKDCVIQDDMRRLYPKLMAADAIVIASPIYWFTVSAQTKLFMDRWYALGGEGGYALAGKKFGVVLSYADADPFVSGAVNALRTFQDVFNYLGCELVGSVYGSAWKAGEIRGNETVMKAAYELGRTIAAA